jgi:hypothetical protein
MLKSNNVNFVHAFQRSFGHTFVSSSRYLLRFNIGLGNLGRSGRPDYGCPRGRRARHDQRRYPVFCIVCTIQHHH